MKRNLLWLLLLLVVMALIPSGIWRKPVPLHDPVVGRARHDGLDIEMGGHTPAEVLHQDGGAALLKVDMRYSKVLRLTVSFEGKPSGWSLNVGDSRSNNGYGGDASDQYWDAELQVLNGNLDVYGSDLLGPAPRHLKSWGKVVSQGDVLVVEISDGMVVFRGPQMKGELRHPALFALNGQAEPNQGKPNYDLFVGVNRVVAGDRTGEGVNYIKLECLEPRSASLPTTDAAVGGTAP